MLNPTVYHENLRVKPSARTIYRTINLIEGNNQVSPSLLDAKLTNEFFVSIGPLLTTKLSETEKKTKKTSYQKFGLSNGESFRGYGFYQTDEN